MRRLADQAGNMHNKSTGAVSMQRKTGSIPENVALIPDGNRRWAKSHRLSLLTGYSRGVTKAIDFGMWLKDLGAKTLTIWALSTENIGSRSAVELNVLYQLYIRAANDKKLLKLLADNHTRVNIIGNMRMLPDNVRRALRLLESKTRKYSDFSINLLVAYGGRDDILYAARKAASAAAHGNGTRITEDMIESELRTASVPDPDLIIRTSGEQRLSGFLPWQSSYSELYFSKKYWGDFSKDDLQRAVSEFSKRRRRYGK